MYFLCHNIGVSPNNQAHVRANYNTREQIAGTNGVLTFDGVYKNVYENKDLLAGREVILFVMGAYVGKDNAFDVNMPREQYCNWNEIMEMVVDLGCELGWHTWSHRDLTTLSEDEVLEEITPPFPMKHFAYPYGRWDERIKELVMGQYEKAFSVGATDGSDYTIQRNYV